MGRPTKLLLALAAGKAGEGGADPRAPAESNGARWFPVALRERIENEVFFATPAPRAKEPDIAEDVFYAGRPRPPVEVPLAVRAAMTPIRFALVILAIGWAGILFQAGLLQQIVFGAPVFEELAKLGPALAIVALLRTRSLLVRLPLALAAGAAFGVMEHYLTYAEEPTYVYAGRVAFHAVSPALSMLVYGGLEELPDVRARWAATLPATLFHWANNFAALAFGVGGIFVPFDLEPIALGWGSLITLSMISLVLVGFALRARFEAAVRRIVEVAMPRLGIVPAASAA